MWPISSVAPTGEQNLPNFGALADTQLLKYLILFIFTTYLYTILCDITETVWLGRLLAHSLPTACVLLVSRRTRLRRESSRYDTSTIVFFVFSIRCVLAECSLRKCSYICGLASSSLSHHVSHQCTSKKNVSHQCRLCLLPYFGLSSRHVLF
jgi:hypothetical protein